MEYGFKVNEQPTQHISYTHSYGIAQLFQSFKFGKSAEPSIFHHESPMNLVLKQ